MGIGYCRPDSCNVGDAECRINGYVKDGLTNLECQNACLNDPSCTGYSNTEADSSDDPPCFNYGNFENMRSYQGWSTYTKRFFVPSPTKTNGYSKSKCYRRTIQPTPNAIQGKAK